MGPIERKNGVMASGDPSSPGRVRTRLDRWRESSFGPASETPFRRRWSDGVRVAISVLVVTRSRSRPTTSIPTEQAVYQFFSSLPDGLSALANDVFAIGGLWALGLVLAAALLARRWRLAATMAIAGAIAWVLARLIGVLVVDHLSLSQAYDTITRSGDTPSFPLTRAALLTAVVAAASPYLSRPMRRLAWLVLFGLVLAALYLGLAFATGILGGVFLGWGVAALVHLVQGSPGGRPTVRQVEATLRELGIAADSVGLAPVQPTGYSRFTATDARGSLHVKVIGRDEADAQFLGKLSRWVAYKDSGPKLSLTRLGQVEHEALAMLLADAGGTAVPDVLVVGEAGPGAALLVEREVAAPLLGDAAPEAVTDDWLHDLWTGVDHLHGARVVHGQLNGSHVQLEPDGPVFLRFDRASVTAEPTERSKDVAELLAATAALVGKDRAVAACFGVLGAARLEQALPVLQPAAISRETRAALGAKRKEVSTALTDLRTLAATTAGVEEPQLQELHRVSGSNLALAIGTLIAVFVMLGQLGSPQELWDTLQTANWWYVVLAFVLSMLTNIGYAIALMGCIPRRLPLWPTIETQVAMSFSNLAIPAVGGIAVQIRFLQKQGVDLASAVAAGGLLSTVGNVVVQIILFLVALWLAPSELPSFTDVNANEVAKLALLVFLVGGVAVALILGIPRLHKAVVPPVKQAAGTVWDAIRQPRQLLLLFVGNLIVSLLYGLTLEACIMAYGASINFWTLLALNIGISTIASLIPVPGGNTAFAAVGMSGALAAFGVPEAAAVAAVLTQQVVVTYLPAFPGFVATRDLMANDFI